MSGPERGVVIVTGAAGGIGSAVHRLLVDRGVHPVLVDAAAPSSAADLPGTWIHGNVRSRATAHEAVAAALAAGSLRGLANVAGMREYRPFLEIDDELLSEHLAVNLLGPMNMMQAAADAMTQTGGGSIVNVTSIMAHSAVPANAAYCATKSGLLGLSRAAAVDLAPFGIRVNCVAPGPTETPMLASGSAVPTNVIDRIPLGRLGNPVDPANAIVFLLSDDNAFITGSTVRVDGGYLAL